MLFSRKRKNTNAKRNLLSGRTDKRATLGRLRALRCEPLEDRRMLSIGGYPEILGMTLLDPMEGQLDGQLVYLDTDGEQGVTYDGPVVVDGVDVPAFSVPESLAGAENQIIAGVVQQLEETFADQGIVFTTIQPINSEYSTLYLGGNDSAFGKYGSFRGLAEQVDLGNIDRKDNAFVFTENLFYSDATQDEATSRIAEVATHELGHLLGYVHDEESTISIGLLDDVADGTATVEIVSIDGAWERDGQLSVDYGDSVDIAVRYKLSGASGTGPWNTDEVGLYNNNGLFWDSTISTTATATDITYQDTWYGGTFHDINLSNNQDFIDWNQGIELYAYVDIDSSTTFTMDATDESPIKIVTINYFFPTMQTISFDGTNGDIGGTPSFGFSLANVSAESVSYTLSENASWLSFKNSSDDNTSGTVSGDSNAGVYIEADTSGLTLNQTYNTTITVSSSVGTFDIPVSYTNTGWDEPLAERESPAWSSVNIAPTETVTFTAQGTDDYGNLCYAKWYIDDSLVQTYSFTSTSSHESSYSYAFDNQGDYTASCIFVDEEGNTSEEHPNSNATWNVHVAGGDIDFNVDDYNGNNQSGVTVKLYSFQKDAWLPSEITNASGNVSFDDLPVGRYNVEFYYQGEFWGSIWSNDGAIDLADGEVKSISFKRVEPYANGVCIEWGGADVAGATIEQDATVNCKVNVYNDSTAMRTIRVTTALYQGQTNVSSGIVELDLEFEGDHQVETELTASLTGDYSVKVVVETLIGSKWIVTDFYQTTSENFSVAEPQRVTGIQFRDAAGNTVNDCYPGDVLRVHVTAANMAWQVVPVSIYKMPAGVIIDSIEVPVNANGVGSQLWSVPTYVGMQDGSFKIATPDAIEFEASIDFHRVRPLEDPTFGTTILVHGYDPELPSKWGGDKIIAEYWKSEKIADLQDAYGNAAIYIYQTNTGQFKELTSTEYGNYGFSKPNKYDANGYEKILVFDWMDSSNDNSAGTAEAAAEALFAGLIEGEYVDLNADTDDNLHFIAHSRGTVVTSETIQRLGIYGEVVDCVTLLDIHDFAEGEVPCDQHFHDPTVQMWNNIRYVENVYEENNFTGVPSGRNHPQIVDGYVYDRDVTEEIHVGAWDPIPVYDSGIHSRVIDYYFGTVAPYTQPEDWYKADGSTSSYGTDTGFSYWIDLGGHGYDGNVDTDGDGEDDYHQQCFVHDDYSVDPRVDPLENLEDLPSFGSGDNDAADPYLAIGDFDLRHLGLTGNIAGWDYFGGESNDASVTAGNTLTLGSSEEVTHNRVYFPPTAKQLALDVLSWPISAEGQVDIYLDDNRADSLGTLHISNTTETPVHLTVDISDYVGEIHTFTIAMSGITGLCIDDVHFAFTPEASADSMGILAESSDPVEIDVDYFAANAIDTATIGVNDIVVIGPDGTEYPASYKAPPTSFMSMAAGDTTSYTANATYIVAPIGGTWDPVDNGIYTIRVVGDAVLDSEGNAVPAGDIATFPVRINDAAPVAAIIDITITPSESGGDLVTFNGQATDNGTIMLYQWYSDLDGYLGEGPSLEKAVMEFTVGTHQISLQVQDNTGQWSTDATQTFVIDDETPIAEIRYLPETPVPPSVAMTLELFTQDQDENLTSIVAREYEILDSTTTLIESGNATESFVLTTPSTPDVYTFRFRAQDDEGTWSAWAEQPFTVEVGATVPMPEITIFDAEIIEGQSGTTELTFQVTLSQEWHVPISVDFSTADVTANVDIDYTETVGTITFSPSQTVRTITVPITVDDDAEAVETLQVNLSNAVGATLLDSQAIGTIIDDDSTSEMVDDYWAPSGQTLTVDAASGVLANDSVPGGGLLSAMVEQTPLHGTLTFNSDGSFTYTPDDTYQGYDYFTYHAQGALTSSQPITVWLIYIPDANLLQKLKDATSSAGIPTHNQLAGLTSLYADYSNITNLTGIQHSGNLEYLYLDGNSLIDLSPMADAEWANLSTLRLSNNSISDLQPLAEAGVANLLDLNLYGNLISDLSPLAEAGWNRLVELNLGWNAIDNLAPLAEAGLTSIESLNLSSNSISDLSPFVETEWTDLTYLDLRDNLIRDLVPLAEAEWTNLECLVLSSNIISDLSPLAEAELNNLGGLYLRSNVISDLSPLAGSEWNNLQYFSLDYNFISDLGPLTEVNLTNLTTLYLRGNMISDLTPLVNAVLPNLTELYLYDNSISDLSPLAEAEWSNLRTLPLSNNLISDLSPLAEVEWPNLSTLALENNLITDLSPLAEAEWTNLNSLYLSNNLITDLSPLIIAGLTDFHEYNFDILANPLSSDARHAQLDTFTNSYSVHAIGNAVLEIYRDPLLGIDEGWLTIEVYASSLLESITVTAPDNTTYSLAPSASNGLWYLLVPGGTTDPAELKSLFPDGDYHFTFTYPEPDPQYFGTTTDSLTKSFTWGDMPDTPLLISPTLPTGSQIEPASTIIAMQPSDDETDAYGRDISSVFDRVWPDRIGDNTWELCNHLSPDAQYLVGAYTYSWDWPNQPTQQTEVLHYYTDTSITGTLSVDLPSDDIVLEVLPTYRRSTYELGSILCLGDMNNMPMVPDEYRVRAEYEGDVWETVVTITEGAYVTVTFPDPTEYVVNSLSDVVAEDGLLTLREAILAADSNEPVGDAPAGVPFLTETITFDPSLTGGTIYLDGSPLCISEDVTITGLGAEQLTIDAQGQSRAFVITGYHSDVAISGLTITSGSAVDLDANNYGWYPAGGAILLGEDSTPDDYSFYVANHSVLTLDDMVFYNNEAYYGGAVMNYMAELSITNSRFIANTGADCGGAVSGIHSINSISDCEFLNNQAFYGGAIGDCAGSEYCVTDSFFAGNRANCYGGAINMSEEGRLTLIHSELLGNNAGRNGGAVSVRWYSSASIIDSILEGNMAGDFGGGVHGKITRSLSITNTLIVGNSATDGGGVAVEGTESTNTTTIVNSTIASNRANWSGAGIVVLDNVPVTLQNSLIVNDVRLYGDYDIIGPITSDSSHNLIGTGDQLTGIADGTYGNQIGTKASPIDPGFVAPRTMPHAGFDMTWGTSDDVRGDYTFLETSPAVNAGDTAWAIDTSGDPLAFDLRGPGYARVIGDAVDIGALETPIAADLNATLDQNAVFTQQLFTNASLPLGWYVELVDSPEYGDATITSEGLATYTPPTDYLGLIDFTYRLTDGVIDSAPGTITLLYLPTGPIVVSTDLDEFDQHGPVDGLSLREALWLAEQHDGEDTIEFAPEFHTTPTTITLNGTPLEIASDVTINGPGAELLSIDANHQSYVIYIDSSITVMLDGLTITGGYWPNDGISGFFNHGTLTVTNSIISGNDAGQAYNSSSGTLTLINSTISTGSADGRLPGIENDGMLTIIGSTISGNLTGTGGGIWNRGTLNITDSTISDNSATFGGGIYNLGEGILTVTNSTITGNSASKSGGGIYNKGIMTVANSDISGNSATSRGGGIYNEGDLIVNSSSISGNECGGSGGALATDHGTVSIANSTISGNSGGGIDNWYGELRIINSTICCNTSVGAAGIYSAYSFLLVNSIVALNTASYDPDIMIEQGSLDPASDYNLIGTIAWVQISDKPQSNSLWGTRDEPLDPMLTAITDEEGTVLYYRPQPGSPVIDAGSNALATNPDGNPLSVDALGSARVQNGVVDMGAVEFTDSPELVVNPTPTVDIVEGESTPVQVSLRAAPTGSVSVVINQESGETGIVSVNQTVLLFDEANWNVPQTVTFSVAEDADRDNEQCIFSLSSDGMDTVRLTIKAIDNDFQTYVVNSLADDIEADGYLTLREALEAANTNMPVGDADRGCEGLADRITFSEALFTEGPATIVLGGTQLEITDDIVIDGPGMDTLIVDANRQSRVFYIDADVTATFNKLTITGGFAHDIDPDDWNDMDGGGIYSEGTLTLESVNVMNNSASDIGGGIFASFTPLIIRNSKIQGNSALRDGNGRGGGISDFFGPITITNSTIVGNTADTGGGIYSGVGTVAIANSTVTANTATESHGGIYHDTRRGTLLLNNSIVALNVAAEDNADMEKPPAANSGGNLIGMDPKFVRNPSDGGDGWVDDPETTEIDEAANNDYGNLRLTSQSPAIDDGLDSAVPGWLTADLDGNPRIYGAHVDIGAYEYQGSPAAGREIPSAVVTTLDDSFDLYDGLISLREAIFYRQSETINEIITFDSTLDGGTILLVNGELGISRPLTIDASSLSSLVIDANYESRVFSVTGNDVILNSLTIINGQASNGGGVLNQGSLAILNSVIADNVLGGGVYNSGTLSIVNSVISDNVSTSRGGGVYNDYNAALIITESIVCGNSVTSNSGRGGGIYNAGELTVMNSIIVGNATPKDGGGIYHSIYYHTAILNIINSAISGNTAENGGGIYAYKYDEQWNWIPGPFTLTNSILALNTATNNLDYYGTLIPESTNNLIEVDPLFVRNPSDGGDGWGDDPATAEIDESANDDYGNLQLLVDSPAIDAGDNALAVDADGILLCYDLDGNPRVQNGTVDIGAYEFDPLNVDAGGPYLIDEGGSVLLNVSATSVTGNDIVSYEWDFDNDGVYDNGSGETVNFSTVASGCYTVRVKVTDSVGVWGMDESIVTVNNLAPIADAAGPYEGDQGNTITLSAAGSIDPGNDIVSYEWDFDNDGLYDDALGMTVDYHASTAGTFTVAVKVTDDDGASDTDLVEVMVLANLIPGDANGDGRVDGSDVTILAGNWQAGVPDGDPENVTWSMGDFNADGKVDGSDVTILAGNWQAGVASTVVATSTSEPEQEPTRQFIPPANASLGVATVPRRESLPPRRFITSTPESTDAVLTESSWSATDIMAIAKDLTSVSVKKSTAASDKLFALELDPYADLE